MNNASDFDATITHCPICGKATHATESNDLDQSLEEALEDSSAAPFADHTITITTIHQLTKETANV